MLRGLILLLVVVGFFYCGSVTTNSFESSGSIDIRVWVDPGSKSPEKRNTTWDRLIVFISSDSGNLLDTVVLTSDESLYSIVENNLIANINQKITLYTIDVMGDTIHAPVTDSVVITPGSNPILTFALYPSKGSMYLLLNKFSSDIDSVLFSFSTPSDTFIVKEKQSSKFYATLDKIPFGLTGTIKVSGFDTLGAEVISWKLEDYTFTNDNTTLEANFLNVGLATFDISIEEPGNMLIWGAMDKTVATQKEMPSPDSTIIISEFMNSAGSGSSSCDYIELYNASTTFDSIIFDELTLVIGDNKNRVLKNVMIKKNGFYVIGAKGITDLAKWSVDTVLDVDLVTTSDYISLFDKSGKLLDKIFYQVNESSMDWPKISSSAKTALILDSLPASPLYNNYGANWEIAESEVHPDFSDYFGTPGKAGK